MRLGTTRLHTVNPPYLYEGVKWGGGGADVIISGEGVSTAYLTLVV